MPKHPTHFLISHATENWELAVSSQPDLLDSCGVGNQSVLSRGKVKKKNLLLTMWQLQWQPFNLKTVLGVDVTMKVSIC